MSERLKTDNESIGHGATGEPEPTFYKKVSCAIAIIASGAKNAGERPKHVLMYPHKNYLDNDVELEAAMFLSRVHGRLLTVLPHEDLEQILKDQDERLSFALER